MGSLNMNSGLVNDWMASNGSSFNAASTAGQSSLDEINPFQFGSTSSSTPSLSTLGSTSKPIATQNVFADFAQFPSSSSNNVLPNTVTAPSNGITAGINWGLTPINPAQSSLPSSDLWQ